MMLLLSFYVNAVSMSLKASFYATDPSLPYPPRWTHPAVGKNIATLKKQYCISYIIVKVKVNVSVEKMFVGFAETLSLVF